MIYLKLCASGSLFWRSSRTHCDTIEHWYRIRFTPRSAPSAHRRPIVLRRAHVPRAEFSPSCYFAWNGKTMLKGHSQRERERELLAQLILCFGPKAHRAPQEQAGCGGGGGLWIRIQKVKKCQIKTEKGKEIGNNCNFIKFFKVNLHKIHCFLILSNLLCFYT